MTFDENTFNPCDICREHKCDVCILHMLVEEDLKRGKWIDGKCINCDFDIRCLIDGESEFERWVWDECFSYCPNCGAKMEVK